MLFSQELFHLEYLFLTPFDTFDTCYYFGLNLNLMLLIKGGEGEWSYTELGNINICVY